VKELYSLQAKRSYPFYYAFLTKKGVIIIAISAFVVGGIIFSLPFPLPVKLGLWIAASYGTAKVLLSQFPILEPDVRHSFLQALWKKRWEVEGNSCQKKRLAEALRRKYGKC
jgi:hypothetical protein